MVVHLSADPGDHARDDVGRVGRIPVLPQELAQTLEFCPLAVATALEFEPPKPPIPGQTPVAGEAEELKRRQPPARGVGAGGRFGSRWQEVRLIPV